MKILAFGSSSTRTLGLTDELRSMNNSFSKFSVRAVAVSGATITGFGKRKSSLDIREKFIDEIESYQPDYICLSLGQTDIELGFYYKTLIKGEDISPDEYIDNLSKNYSTYVNNLCKELKIKKDTIIIKGVNPPVITRYRIKAIKYTINEMLKNNFTIEEKQNYISELKKTFPSAYERYSYHKKFNVNIKKTAKIYGYKYFDVDDIVSDPNNQGHVKEEFTFANADHHIIDSLYIRKAFISKLIQTIYT